MSLPANPPFNNSDTAITAYAFLGSEATMQVVSAAKDNMFALPSQLFYRTQISVCRWFLAKDNTADAKA